MLAKKNRITLTVLILVAFAALITGLFVAQHVSFDKTIDTSRFHGTWLPEPRQVAAFALTGSDSMPFDNHSLQGQWTMMFFGFTHCGGICPTTMAELAKMYRILEDKKVTPLPRVVFISLDPSRDSLEKLKQYAGAFHPNFYAARGDEADIKQMTKEFGIVFEQQAPINPKEPGHYDIQHTGAIMLFNPKGQLNAFFTMPHQASQLADDYQLLVPSTAK